MTGRYTIRAIERLTATGVFFNCIFHLQPLAENLSASRSAPENVVTMRRPEWKIDQ